MHLDEGTIHAWLDGALDAEEARRVERHAAECETCRAAVAEARGLIAGSSRILSALDDVPSGVVPNSPAFGGAGRGRQRPRSLWNVLHFTPTRAAAAAVVLVAAGTALVLMQGPNERAQYATVRSVTDSVRRSHPLSVPASPVPAPAVDSVSVKVARKDEESAPRPLRVPTDLPAPVVAQAPAGRAGHAEKKLDSVGVAPAPVPMVANSNSMPSRDAAIRDSARLFLSETKRASAGAVAGLVPTAALPPAASKGFRTEASMAGLDFSGCYEVVGAIDSTSGLPRRLSLDTTRLDQVARAPLALQRTASAGNAAQSDRYAISALTSEGRRPVERAYWQAVPGVGARLTIESPTPHTMQISVRPDSISALSEAVVTSTRGENREPSPSVTLRRVSCPAQ